MHRSALSRSRSRSRSLSVAAAFGVAAALSLGAGACANDAGSPHMRAQSPAPAIDARADAATIVFVRGASACDRWGWITVVDERGAFVGDSAPKSRFAITAPPGEHVFFGWDELREVDAEKYPTVNQTGAVRLVVSAGMTYFVEVGYAGGAFQTRRTCPPWPRTELVATGASRGRELAEEATAFAPDTASGDRALAEKPQDLERRLTMARSRLRSVDAREERQDKEERKHQPNDPK